MKANKIIYDLYSTSGGKMSHEDYKKFYEKNDEVYIILVDENIYTKVKRQVMFDKGLNLGCFIDHVPCDTPEEVRVEALRLVNDLHCVFVTVDEFKDIEKKKETSRVASAFFTAEQLIRGN